MRRQTKILTKLCAILCVSFSLSACVNPPKKPVGNIGALNAKPTSAPKPYLLTFNFETDFNDDLTLKPGVKGVRKEVSLDDLDRNWVLDAKSKEELVRYALEWKQRAELMKKQLDECRSGR